VVRAAAAVVTVESAAVVVPVAGSTKQTKTILVRAVS
jgi:hypothetical protein